MQMEQILKKLNINHGRKLQKKEDILKENLLKSLRTFWR